MTVGDAREQDYLTVTGTVARLQSERFSCVVGLRKMLNRSHA